MYNRNKSGPKTEPWGTPWIIDKISNKTEYILFRHKQKSNTNPVWSNLFQFPISFMNVMLDFFIYRIVQCISRGFKHIKKVQYLALDLYILIYTGYTSSGIFISIYFNHKYCQIFSRIKVIFVIHHQPFSPASCF